LRRQANMNVTAIVSAYYSKMFLKKRMDNLMYQITRPEIVVVCQKGSLEEAIAKTYDVTWILTPHFGRLSRSSMTIT